MNVMCLPRRLPPTGPVIQIESPGLAPERQTGPTQPSHGLASMATSITSGWSQLVVSPPIIFVVGSKLCHFGLRRLQRGLAFGQLLLQ